MQNKSERRFAPHLSRSRHRGQALLIAIVVMLFAAIISAGFLATVTGNLNQRARETEKAKAAEAARAGLDFINRRLVTDPLGENWRPQEGVPAATDSYFSDLMRAQGWAGNFARFPDPRRSDVEGPQFLARVERIPMSQVASEATRAGSLKITIIGLSHSDPSVFSRLVAYRGGPAGAPVGRAMRVVSNWDFEKNAAIRGVVAGAVSTGATAITLSQVEGNFPSIDKSEGFWLSVITPSGTPLPVFATNFDSSTKTLTTEAITGPIPALSRVELAANLGAPTTIPLSSAAPTPIPLPTLAATVEAATGNTAPESVRVNGGIYWEGDTTITGLRPQSATDYPSTIRASGAIMGSSGVQFDGQPVSLRSATVQDGVGAVTQDFDPNRQVRPFSPPNLASTQNLARYRGLTRDDEDGIYIDNPSDRERLWNGIRYAEMTQRELMDLWLSPDDLELQYRAPTASLPTPNTTSASLEEKHLRGWIAPDEFRARGALIEIFSQGAAPGTPKIRITRDALTDGSSGTTPVDSKAIAPGNYVELRDLNDTNGTIFAEGNIRIKGEATGASTSLTVVSMGNIYIEGPLGLDGGRKVLLLARKNVIVNPTAVISRPEAYTNSTGASPASAPFTIPVVNSAGFQQGDFVRVGTSLRPLKIVATTPTSLTVDQNPNVSGTPTLIQMARDTVSSTAAPRTDFSQLASYNGVLQRRIPTGTATTQNLAFRHISEKISAGTVGITPGIGQPTQVWLTIKTAANSTDLFTGSKELRVDSGNSEAPLSLVSNSTLADLKTSIEGASYFPPTPATWRYSLTLPPDFGTVRSFALAGIGNVQRPAQDLGSFPWRRDLLQSPPDNELVLANSVSASFDGASFLGDPTNAVRDFGFNILPTANEDLKTVDSTFYSAPADYASQAIVDARQITAIPAASSPQTFAFKFNGDEATTGLADVDTTPTVDNRMPAYNLFATKIENLDSAGDYNGAGVTWNIRAYVYAQTGSWMIIPGDYFQGSAPAATARRNARYNYAIRFTGAIAENQTALINDHPTAVGAVADWMNKWTVPPVGAATQWQPITYTFDSDYLEGALDNPVSGGKGFRMPLGDDILVQSSG